MVIRRDSVLERLKELDMVLQELNRHRDVELETLRTDISQRWIVERGLISAAALILDVADHILTGQFGFYAASYEETLQGLRDKQVISTGLHEQIRGLGGFRNVLVHQYQNIDPAQVRESLQKGLVVFPRFGKEIIAWLDDMD